MAWNDHYLDSDEPILATMPDGGENSICIRMGRQVTPSKLWMSRSQGEALLAQLKRLFGQAETTKPTRQQELDTIWRKLDALGGPINRFDAEEVMFDRRLGVAIAAVEDMGGMDPEQRARRAVSALSAQADRVAALHQHSTHKEMVA